MPELYVAQANYEEAKKLADLASIYQDLSFTIDTLKRLSGLLEDNKQDNVLEQSLWTTALISYARCFSSGKRFGLSESIFEKLKGEPTKCHRYYKDLRDKHIAHSVNPFEQVDVGLVLSEPDSQEREVLGVATLSQKLICTDIEGVKTLLMLASVVREEVARQAKEYQAKTLEVGKGLPIDGLYAKATIRTVTPGPEDAGIARE